MSDYIYEAVKEHSMQTVFVLIDLGSKACKQAVGELVAKEDNGRKNH